MSGALSRRLVPFALRTPLLMVRLRALFWLECWTEGG
jgi:hypothetical protein